MALNIDLDGFGFLDSVLDGPNPKLSPTLNKPPVSPIESESSSGISSVDSDDLKKQLLSSPPTISISHDDDQQSSDGDAVMNDKEVNDDENLMATSANINEDEKQTVDEGLDGMVELVAETNETKSASGTDSDVVQAPVHVPVEVIYQNRNILNLAANVWNSGNFIQFTVLPKNNLSCFFQNRAQYWRLGDSTSNERLDTLEKCSCCDFTYPSVINPHHLIQNGQNTANSKMAKNNNAITDSLLTFLKNHHVEYNNTPTPTATVMPNHNKQPQQPQRIYNNTNSSAPYAAYQIIQQQYQTNGYYNNNNTAMNGYNHQQMNQFNGNTNGSGGYNNPNSGNGNSTLALLNLMNQSRNVPVAGAFQQAMNNNSRYYNNNMNTNGYGLYKQF